MIINFSPVRNDDRLVYKFDCETITATFISSTGDEIIDAFDFSGLNEGDEVARNEETGELEIETNLPTLPILRVKRENGQIVVTLLKYHKQDAPYEERFPEPLEV